MPLKINPSDYGQQNPLNLAEIAGTIQGEVRPGSGVYNRAMVADTAANRVTPSPRLSALPLESFSPATAQYDGGTLTGMAAQMRNPDQFSTWRPKEASAYANATRMRDTISSIMKDPSAFDRLAPSYQQDVLNTLEAIRGVSGSGELRGVSGGATSYSVPSILSPERKAEHEKLGSSFGIEAGGNVFYGQNADLSRSVNQAATNFDYSGALARLNANMPEGTPVVTPLPPGRPNDGSNGIAPRSDDPAALAALGNVFGNLTGGLRDAASGIVSGFQNLTGRLPGADELQSRLQAIGSGASNIVQQIGDIASSPEAKTFQQATGIDPMQYAADDIYRLGLGRGLTDGDSNYAMGVIRSGGSLNDLAKNIASSQEGQTYALGNFYDSAFGRSIDPGGLQSALAQLQGGTSLSDLEKSLLGSPEAQARGITQADIPNFLTPNFATPTITGNTGTTTVDPTNVGTSTGTIGNPGWTATGGTGTTSTSGGTGTSTGGNPNLPIIDVGTQGGGTTVLTQGAGTSVDPVDNLFRAILQRPGDAPGLQKYDAELQAGRMDLNQIAHALAGSDEAKTHGATQVPTFTQADTVYARDLGRLADTAGQQQFDAMVKAGLPTNLIEAQILGSQEAQARAPDTLAQVLQSYSNNNGISAPAAQTLSPFANEFSQVIGRGMDAQTQQVWSQAIQQGRAPEMEAQLLSAPEAIQARTGRLEDLTNQYKSTYGLTPTEVNALAPLTTEYATLLGGRGVDVPTLNQWNSQVNAGTPLNMIEAQLLAAPEVKTQNSPELATLIHNYTQTNGVAPEQALTLAPLMSEYAQLTGHQVDTPTLGSWGQQISAGTPLSMLEAGLLQAPEVQTGNHPALAGLVNQFGQTYGINPSQALQVAPLVSDYSAALGRAPDVGTIAGWGQQLAGGSSMQGLEAQLLMAPEVQSRTGGQGTLFQQFGSQYGISPNDYLNPAPAYTPPGISDPFFSSANVGGALGAQPQFVTSGLGGGGGGYIPDGGAGTVEENRTTPEFEGTGTGGLGDAAGPAPPDPYAGAAAAANSFNSAYANYLRDTANGGAAPEQTNPNVWNQQLAQQDAARQAQNRATFIANANHMGVYGPTLGGFTTGGFTNVGTYVAPGGMIG